MKKDEGLLDQQQARMKVEQQKIPTGAPSKPVAPGGATVASTPPPPPPPQQQAPQGPPLNPAFSAPPPAPMKQGMALPPANRGGGGGLNPTGRAPSGGSSNLNQAGKDAILQAIANGTGIPTRTPGIGSDGKILPPGAGGLPGKEQPGAGGQTGKDIGESINDSARDAIRDAEDSSRDPALREDGPLVPGAEEVSAELTAPNIADLAGRLGIDFADRESLINGFINDMLNERDLTERGAMLEEIFGDQLGMDQANLSARMGRAGMASSGAIGAMGADLSRKSNQALTQSLFAEQDKSDARRMAGFDAALSDQQSKQDALANAISIGLLAEEFDLTDEEMQRFFNSMGIEGVEMGGDGEGDADTVGGVEVISRQGNLAIVASPPPGFVRDESADSTGTVGGRRVRWETYRDPESGDYVAVQVYI